MQDNNYQKEYYERKKNDPEWIEKRRKRSREYWKTLKERDPEKYNQHLEKKKQREKEMREFYRKQKNK
mgnify:CR=1 FL=1